MVSIADACELVTDGTHYTPKDLGRGIPFLTVRDVSDAILDFTNCSFISESDYLAAKAGNSAPKNGDVLFSKDGTVGKVHVVRTNQPFAVLSSLAILRPKRDHVDPGYLGHVLRSPSVLDDALKKKTGSAIRRIVLGDLKRVRLPLPPLSEQRRIAAILDQAETLRTQRRAALAQLDSLTQSLFLDMFGDPVTNPKSWQRPMFGEVGRLDRGISKHRPRNAPELLGGPYPLVQTGEVANCDGYIREYNNTYSEIGLRQSKMWPKGTLCITIAANIAKTGILTFDACFPDSVVGFRAVDPATVEYVRVWLSFLQKALEDSAPESAQKNINLAILRALPLPLPPLPLQQTFATRIQAIESLKAKHRAALAELDALFASLQHRAFSGELNAQGATATQPQPRRFAELGQLDTSKGLEALVYAARRLPGKGHYWPLKAQYVADKHHLERHGKTIYGETHMAMPYGPVPQAAYNASRALAQGELICEFPMDAVRTALRRDGDALVALRDADTQVLGEHERESLDWAIRLVADLSFDELKTQTHDEAWKKTMQTAPNGPLAWRDIIDTLPPAAQKRLLATFG